MMQLKKPLNEMKGVDERTILAAQVTRDDYILECFNRDHKGYDLPIEKVKEFISRSKHMQAWFRSVMETYRITYEMPEVAREFLSTDDFNKIKRDLTNYSKSLTNEGNEIANESIKFNARIKEIQKREKQVRDNITSSQLIRILTLDASDLPFKEQVRIINFDNQQTEVKDEITGKYITDPKAFKKHVFNAWIRKLLKMNKEGKDVTVEIESDAKDWSSPGVNN